MCVSVTVLVATLVLLQGVGGGNSLQMHERQRTPENTVDLCLKKCLRKFYRSPPWAPKLTPPPLSNECCHWKTLDCVMSCKIRQKVNSTSVTQDYDLTDSSEYNGDIRGAATEVINAAFKDAVTVCQCRRQRKSRSAPLREAALVARSVGLDLMSAGLESRPRSSKVENVRVTSQSRGEDTVSVEVAWEATATSASGHLFLVTWQAQGDALKGNLLTNTPSTTLSLLPDTVYYLQISSAGADSSSGCLVVDTHPAPRANFTYTQSLSLSLTQEAAGAAAALSALLVLVLLLAVKWRNTRSPAAGKDNAQLRVCDHFKVFPPPVTLLVDPPSSQESPPPSHHPV